MKSKYMGGWLTAISVVGAGMGVYGLQHLPQGERLLLPRAKRVVLAAQFSGSDFQWLSNSSLLFEREWVSTEFLQPRLFRRNLVTGAQTQEVKLRELLFRGDSESWRLSPSGEWGLSSIAEESARDKPPQRYYLVCRTDGTRQIRNEVSNGFIGTRWLADSRHWVELYGRHVVPPGFRGVWGNMNSAPLQIQRVCIRDLDAPDVSRSVNVMASSLLSIPALVGNPFQHSSLFAVTEDRYLTWRQTLFAPKSEVIIDDTGLNSATPRHQYQIMLPGRCRAIQLVFTPDGSRILWKLTEHREASTERQFIHRILPRFDARNVERVSLWVSRIDGSEMREIGGINNPGHVAGEAFNVSGPSDMETGEMFWGPPTPRKIRWTPDGKRIGFIYDRAIWTVSTE